MNERIRIAMEKAHARYAATRPEAGPPRAGLMYLAGRQPIYLALLGQHPDDENLFFAVPVDDHPLVGLCDAAEAAGPWVARCGYGLWIHRDDVTWPAAHKMTDAFLAAVRRRVGQMVRGRLGVERLDEDDPAYERHCRRLARWTWRLERRLRGVA